MDNKNFYPEAVNASLSDERDAQRAAAAKRLAEKMGEHPDGEVAPLTAIANQNPTPPVPTYVGKLNEPSSAGDDTVNVGDGTGGGSVSDVFLRNDQLMNSLENQRGSALKDTFGQAVFGGGSDIINGAYDFLSFTAQAPFVGVDKAKENTFRTPDNNLVPSFPESERVIPNMARFMVDYAAVAIPATMAIEAAPALNFIGAGTALSDAMPAVIRAANNPVTKQLIVGAVADAVVSSHQENISKQLSDYARANGMEPGIFERYMAIDPKDPNASQLHDSLAAVIEGALIQGAFHSLGFIGRAVKPWASKGIMAMVDAAKAQRAIKLAQPEVGAAAEAAAKNLGEAAAKADTTGMVESPNGAAFDDAPVYTDAADVSDATATEASPMIEFDTASGAGATDTGGTGIQAPGPAGSAEFEFAVGQDAVDGGVDSEGGKLASKYADDIKEIRRGVEEDYAKGRWTSGRVIFRTYSRDLWSKVWENRNEFARPLTGKQFKVLRKLWDNEALRWGNETGLPAELWYRHWFGDNPSEMIRFANSAADVGASPDALFQRLGIETKFYHGSTSIQPPITKDNLRTGGNPMSRVGPGLYLASAEDRWFAARYSSGFEHDAEVIAQAEKNLRMPHGRMMEFTVSADFDALDIRKRVSQLSDEDAGRVNRAFMQIAKNIEEDEAARGVKILPVPTKFISLKLGNDFPVQEAWNWLRGRVIAPRFAEDKETFKRGILEVLYRPMREEGFDGVLHDEPLASSFYNPAIKSDGGTALMVMDAGDELHIGRKPPITSTRSVAAPHSRLRAMVFGSTNTQPTMSWMDAWQAQRTSNASTQTIRERAVAIADKIAGDSDGRVELAVFDNGAGPYGSGDILSQFSNPTRIASTTMVSTHTQSKLKTGIGIWSGLEGGQEDFYAIGLHFADDITEEEAKSWTWRIAAEVGIATDQKAMAPALLDVAPKKSLDYTADDIVMMVDTRSGRPAEWLRSELETLGVQNASIEVDTGVVFISSKAGEDSVALRKRIDDWSTQHGYETTAERAYVPDGGVIGSFESVDAAKSEFERIIAESKLGPVGSAVDQARPGEGGGKAGPGVSGAAGNPPDPSAGSGDGGPLYQFGEIPQLKHGPFARGDGDEFFTPEALKEARQSTSGKSRSVIAYMTPDDFIAMARGDVSEVKRAATSEIASSGGKFTDVPRLKFRNEARGVAVAFEQDGQHRALALKDKGVKMMPVVIESDGGANGSIRWNDARNIDIPDKMVGQDGKTSIPFPIEGQPRYQTDAGAAKGMIDFDHEGKAIITMFKGKADFSTFMHETGHLFWRDLEIMPDVDRLALAEWAGVSPGVPYKNWPVAAQEKWARGFEGFAATGKAPAGMERAFNLQRQWMREVYGKIIGTEIDVKLSPEVARLMSNIFSGTGVKLAPRMTYTRDKQTGVAFINHERIATQQDIDGMMQAVADAQTRMVDAATGGAPTRRLADVQREARAMGMSVAQALGLPLNMTDAQAFAVRELEVASAETVVKLADIARKSADPSDMMRFRNAITVHRAINAHVRGQSRTAARLLGSRRLVARATKDKLRAVEEMLNVEGLDTLKGLADKLSAMHDNPEGVDNFIKQLEKATKWDVVHEVFINNLLSAPATYLANSIGNSATVALGLMHTTIGAVGDRVFGKGENVDFQEVAESMVGIIRGMSDGWELAKHAFDDEYVGAGKYEDGLTKQRRALVAETFNQKEGTFLGDAINAIGRTWRTPTRALRSADAFFNSVAYRMELHRLAYRDAVDTFRKAGTKPSKDEIGMHMANFLTSPSGEVIKKAEQYALKQTFMEEFEGGLGRLASQASSVPILRKIIPFARTPLQIMKYGMEETPFAVLSKDFRAKLMSKDANEATIARSRLALSTSMFFAVGDLVDRGMLTGSYSSDPNERESQIRTGVYECSLGPGDDSGNRVGINRIEPVGTALCMMADVWSTIDKIENQDTDELALGVVLHLADTMMSKSSLKGFSDIVAAIKQGRGEVVNSIISNLVSAHVVPAYSFVSAVERTFDPATREKTVSPVDPGITWINRIVAEGMSHIPAMSDTLPMSSDLWGMTKMSMKRSANNWHGKLYEFVSPVPIGSANKDVAPIERAFQRNQYFPTMPPKFVTTENGASVRLTTKEYEAFVARAGRAAFREIKDLWKEIDAMPDDGPTGDKMEMIKRIISDTRADAADEILMGVSPARIAAAEEKASSVTGARQWGLTRRGVDAIKPR